MAKEDNAILADGSRRSRLLAVAPQSLHPVELAIRSTRTSPGRMVCADLRNCVHTNKRIQAQRSREGMRKRKCRPANANAYAYAYAYC